MDIRDTKYIINKYLLDSCDYLCEILIVVNAATDKDNGQNEIWTLNKRWKWSSCKNCRRVQNELMSCLLSWLEHLNETQRLWVISGKFSIAVFFNSLSGKYNIYQFIMWHSCNYLCKILIVVNVATHKGNCQNEIGTLNKRWNWSRCTKLVLSAK